MLENIHFVLDAAPITATSSSSLLSPGFLDGDKGTEALLPPTPRRLGWTNYEHDEREYERGVLLYAAVVGTELERAAAGLGFLELSLSPGAGPISHMLAELSLALTSSTLSLTNDTLHLLHPPRPPSSPPYSF